MSTITLDKSLNFVSDDVVYIHGDFDSSISQHVIPQLKGILNREVGKKSGKIIFDINSDGGATYFLKNILALVEHAKKSGVVIETHAFGRAFSCGSILATSGSKGHRFIGEHTEHLCHLGRAAGYNAGNNEELLRTTDRALAHFDFIKKCYKKYAKIPNLERVIRNDLLFVRGQKIIDWGLADKFF